MASRLRPVIGRYGKAKALSVRLRSSAANSSRGACYGFAGGAINR